MRNDAVIHRAAWIHGRLPGLVEIDQNRDYVRIRGHPTAVAKAKGYANLGIALGRGIDRANQGFPLLEAQWAEDAPSRMLRGAYPHPPHPRNETADLAMIRRGI